MANMPTQKFFDLLISDRLSLTYFVESAINRAAPFAWPCARTSLLVELPFAPSFDVFDQDVEIMFGEARQFFRVQDAWEAGDVHFEVRNLCPAPSVETLPDRGEHPRCVIGFIGTNGLISVRRHSRLECITVQFC